MIVQSEPGCLQQPGAARDPGIGDSRSVTARNPSPPHLPTGISPDNTQLQAGFRIEYPRLRADRPQACAQDWDMGQAPGICMEPNSTARPGVLALH